MRSAEELNRKLTTLERDKNRLFDRMKTLEYQLSEVCGCVEEYIEMPCSSLRFRMASAAKIAEGHINKNNEMETQS